MSNQLKRNKGGELWMAIERKITCVSKHETIEQSSVTFETITRDYCGITRIELNKLTREEVGQFEIGKEYTIKIGE